MIAGVRFVKTTEAKIFHAEPLIEGGLSVKTAIESSTTTVAVKEAISSAQATALAGRKCIIGTNLCTIASASAAAAGSATLTLAAAITAASANAVIYPGEAGAAGRDIYSTLILGKNAYGITDLEGGGLKHIVKQVGSAGSQDALDQRATIGWKRTMAVCILTQTFMLRIETASTFQSGAN
ncbi:MAG: N4-gp56 family major capsid protein [Clostridia bacterium]|nr:N4-gp56 family major capsid protein [Clostridia bacterium]